MVSYLLYNTNDRSIDPQVPPPVTLVNAPPRPPKPPGLRSSCDGHSLCEDNAYDVPVPQSGVDGGAGRIYGNARDMSAASAAAVHCTAVPSSSAFLPDTVDLINVVPPAVNRRLKPKPPHEPVTPPSATVSLKNTQTNIYILSSNSILSETLFSRSIICSHTLHEINPFVRP